MAMTGFFYTFQRPRTARPMGLLKYDPIGRLAIAAHLFRASRGPDADLGKLLTFYPVRKKVLFLEQKRKSGK